MFYKITAWNAPIFAWVFLSLIFVILMTKDFVTMPQAAMLSYAVLLAGCLYWVGRLVFLIVKTFRTRKRRIGWYYRIDGVEYPLERGNFNASDSNVITV